METYLCPGCDTEVPVGSRGCPRCTAAAKQRKRRRTATSASKQGWQQDSESDGLDLPTEDFDYDSFIAREFGIKPHKKIGIKWYWWVTGVVLLGLLIAGVFGVLHGFW